MTNNPVAHTRMRVVDLRPFDRNPRSISPSRLENLKRSLELLINYIEAQWNLKDNQRTTRWVVALPWCRQE